MKLALRPGYNPPNRDYCGKKWVTTRLTNHFLSTRSPLQVVAYGNILCGLIKRSSWDDHWEHHQHVKINAVSRNNYIYRRTAGKNNRCLVKKQIWRFRNSNKFAQKGRPRYTLCTRLAQVPDKTLPLAAERPFLGLWRASRRLG